MASDRLVVLIAEDSPADRMLLSTIVAREGHRVLTAANGLEAVALFEQERPQLVLMDALMPVMDGFEAARRIKQMAGEALVPVIFLTSPTESKALVRCLEAGGDDFLAKPYNRVILVAKIKAMERLRRLQATVLEQRDLIARHNEHLLSEQRVAKAMFDKVAHSGCLDAPNVRYLQSPHALFNGDLLLAAYNPSGDMYVLLGDFTGHGLPAAIGAMPLAEVFYGMAAKGHSMPEILREMNTKLKRILPVGVFCCATLASVSFQRRTLKVWNGGLPDGYLLRADGSREPLVSRHLPLGVLDAEDFDERCEVFPMAPGDRLFLLSDGVLEAENADHQLFGEQRLLAVFDANRQPQRLFDEILTAVERFRGRAQDDISMIEVGMMDVGMLSSAPVPFVDTGQQGPLDWSASFEFRAESLRSFNPLPFLLQLLLEVRGLRGQGGALYSVLAELYSNALEHGVMELDSSLKRDAAGFSRYYRERGERLACLEHGFVRFHLQVRGDQQGGRLELGVEDSGKGFDVARVLAEQERLDGFCGRGLSLVRALSKRCVWERGGTLARAELHW